jgi:hypothetical protein
MGRRMATRMEWLALVALAGCSPHVTPSNARDLSGAIDFGSSPADGGGDLATAGGDGAVLSDGGGDAAVGDVTMAHGALYDYVVSHLVLPKSRMDYAIDLNGDGHPDNQLGEAFAALLAQGVDAQPDVDARVADGTIVHLVALQTADPMLANDATAGAAVLVGQPHPMPDFSGMGRFAVDQAWPAGATFGVLSNNAYRSNDPAVTTHPATITLRIPLFLNMVLALQLHGAHVQFTTAIDPNTAVPSLLHGEIHGSIKESDVQMVIIPALAQGINQKVQSNPSSTTAKDLLRIFDVGGCTNMDGTKAAAGDGKIDPCEVANNMIIRTILAPDVQIYDANGNYAPNPLNTSKDSLSAGVGFTAVRAQF